MRPSFHTLLVLRRKSRQYRHQKMAKKGKKQQQEYSGGAPPIVPATRISWPKLRRHRDLTPRLIRGCEVFTVPGALSPEECADFIAQGERVGFQWQGSGGPAKGEAYRDNHRISVEDNELAGESCKRKRRVGRMRGKAYRDNHRISVEDSELAGESCKRKRRGGRMRGKVCASHKGSPKGEASRHNHRISVEDNELAFESVRKDGGEW
ncbi:unnamed protein product [Closterium sp. NIES-53]